MEVEVEAEVDDEEGRVFDAEEEVEIQGGILDLNGGMHGRGR